MTRRIRALVFDLDDTLLRTSEVYSQCLSQFLDAMVSRGFPRGETADIFEQREDINTRQQGYAAERYAVSMEEAYCELCSRQGRPPTPGDRAMVRRIGATVGKVVPELVDEALAVLDALGRDYLLLLVTRGSLDWQSVKVERRGLATLFSQVFVVPEKTADVYRRVLAEADLSADSVCFIGDSIKADINPALQIGSDAILVRRHVPGYEWKQDADEPARGGYAVVHGLAELPAALKRMEQGRCAARG